jgi:hypothetical protein
MLKTPGGNPASATISANFRADRGVISEGYPDILILTRWERKSLLAFMTIAFPVARAGATFHDNINTGTIKTCRKED